MIIPEWLIQDPFENKPEKISNPESFKQIARERFRKYEKDIAKKMNIPYNFIDGSLHIGFFK